MFTPTPPADAAKLRKGSLIYGGLGMAVFIIGFFVGFAALIGAVLGGYGLRQAISAKYTPGIALGITAIVLNAGFYVVALAMK